MTGGRAADYARFVQRRRREILAAAAVVSLVGAVLASRLTVRTDLAHLLPPSARSVVDLHEVERRAQAFGNLLCLVEAPDPALRERAAGELRRRLDGIDRALVAEVDSGDQALRRFVWENRFLYAPLADLEAARDALVQRIERAKLAANPAYVSFEDDDSGKDDERLTALRKRLEDAEKASKESGETVSADGHIQLLVVRATFPSAEVPKAERLVKLVVAAIEDTRRAVGPGVEIRMTGDVASVTFEHRSILDGMLLATLLTCVLVGAGLLAYYRSLGALLAVCLPLATGTLATFGFARLAIGHLNSATAFLTAIVVVGMAL